MTGVIQNCSVCEKCDGLSEYQTKSVFDTILLKLCDFILISVVVSVLHLLDIIVYTEFKFQRLTLSDVKNQSKRLLQIISLSALTLTLPIIAVLIASALFYKLLCLIAIKRKDKRFVKFLDSFDVFCCLEESKTTDIEGVIRSTTIDLALDNIKDKLHKVFLNYGTDKIFYRRNEDFGFYYWRRYSFIDLAQYVQIVELPETIEHDQSIINNNTIAKSYNDEGLFKVLIIKNSDVINQFKIVLQFHHSVKDAALIKFVARLIEETDDCHVVMVTRPQENTSPYALMSMIAKLVNIMAISLGLKKQDNKTGSFIILKKLEWTKSDENLLCKVIDVKHNVCEYNFADVFGEAFSKILRAFER